MNVVKINDSNFLVVKKMPFVKSIEEFRQWIVSSDCMKYIFSRVKKVLTFDMDSQTWRGINYDVPERVLLSTQPKIRHQTKRFLELLEAEQFDLLKPSYNPYRISDWDNFKTSEVVYMIATNKAIFRYFFIIMVRDDYVKKVDGGWIGVENW